MSAHQQETARHSVSVAGVILDASATRVLLVQRRDNNLWEPPGGVLELNETIEDGLRREIEEETGVTVNIEALTGVYKNMRRGIVALVFRCRALKEPSDATAEASAVVWHPTHAVNALMTPAYAVRVIDALIPQLATIRSHDGTDLLGGNTGPSDHIKRV